MIQNIRRTAKEFFDLAKDNDYENPEHSERLKRYTTIANIQSVERLFFKAKPANQSLQKSIGKALADPSHNIDISNLSLKYISRSIIQAIIAYLEMKKANVLIAFADPKEAFANISLTFKIGNTECKFAFKPFIGHFFNGTVASIGTYSEIHAFFSLITQCINTSDIVLAKKFLTFANKTFEFTKADLIEINSNFSNFDEQLIKYYTKYLTLSAFLILIVEPLRFYLQAEKSSIDKLNVYPTIHTYAIHIMTTLQLIRDGKAKLKCLFDPEYVPTSGNGVRNTSKSKRQQAIEHSIFFLAGGQNANSSIEKKKIRKSAFPSSDSDISDYDSDKEENLWKLTI